MAVAVAARAEMRGLSAIDAAAGESGLAVSLIPTVLGSSLGLRKVKFGSRGIGQFKRAATLGRNPQNDFVLQAEEVAACLCQFALRRLVLPGRFPEEEHEALFLRSQAEVDLEVFVNGRPVVRPWHWLQDKDEVAVGLNLPVLRVKYDALYPIAAHEALVLEAKGKSFAPVTATPSTATSSSRASPYERQAKGAAKARGRSSKGTGKGKATSREPFSEDIINRVVDVTYDNPTATYRVRVADFNVATRLHHVDSEGYSVWVDPEVGDEPFTDVLNLNSMFDQGKIVFIDS
eukprot:TRINITY_DN18752_c0_g1_i3.p1 TRINITY_DN18752_c0_g1~~TRINITY_DN18752_c0_g1_i3.p1  ORF type:complete len:314 (+),score=46.14 TRINITY_DN18752_c0_g1_i3:75-944(+)